MKKKVRWYSEENIVLCTFLRSTSAWHLAKLVLSHTCWLLRQNLWAFAIPHGLCSYHPFWCGASEGPSFWCFYFAWSAGYWLFGNQEVQVSFIGNSLVFSGWLAYRGNFLRIRLYGQTNNPFLHWQRVILWAWCDASEVGGLSPAAGSCPVGSGCVGQACACL